MAVELLINDEVEHSEKHDLESFFYVLLYICMMCEGPGKLRNDENRDDANHPFGNWIHDAKTRHAIGMYRFGAFSDYDVMQRKVLTHVHPYFGPLIHMLTNFCDVIFGTYAEDGGSTRIRNPRKPCGTHKKVLDVLRSAFDILPDEDVSGIPEGPAHATPASTPSGNIIVNRAVDLYVGSEEPGDIRSDSGYGGEEASVTVFRSGGGSSPNKRSSQRRAMPSVGSDSGNGGNGASTSISRSGGGSRSPNKRSQRGVMPAISSVASDSGNGASTSTSRSGDGSRSPNKRSSQQSAMQDAVLPSSKRRHLP